MKTLPEINDEPAVLTLLDLLEPSFKKMMDYFDLNSAFILVQSGDRTYANENEKHIIKTWAKRLVFLPLADEDIDECEALAHKTSILAIRNECKSTDHGRGEGSTCGASVVAPFSCQPHWVVTVTSTKVVICEFFAETILGLLMAAKKQRAYNDDPTGAIISCH